MFLLLSESLIFWSSSVKAFTGNQDGGRAPVILVGTHGDKVDDQTAEKKFREARKIMNMDLINCIRIDNTITMNVKNVNSDEDPEDLKELRELILNCGLGIADEKVPARWIDLLNTIGQEEVQKKGIMNMDDMERLNRKMDQPLQEKESIQNFLEHMHCRGELLYYPECDLIILNLNLIVEFLNTTMRTPDQNKIHQKAVVEDTHNQGGMVSEAFLMSAAESLLTDDLARRAKSLVDTLTHLKIAHEYKVEEHNAFYILPSLLGDKNEEADNEPSRNGMRLKVTFQADGSKLLVPVGFYHNFVITLLTDVGDLYLQKVENILQIFRKYACLYYKDFKTLTDIYWKSAAIYIEISSSSDEINLEVEDQEMLVGAIEKALKKTLGIYRHKNIGHFLGIECPKHRNNFLDVSVLRKKGEDLCEKRHIVKKEELGGSLQGSIFQVTFSHVFFFILNFVWSLSKLK